MAATAKVRCLPSVLCIIADASVMQAMGARAAIIVAVRTRINANVSGRLNEREAVQVALASSMRDSDDVIGFLLPVHLSRIVLRSREVCKLQKDEWAGLFGFGLQALRDGGIASIVRSEEFGPEIVRLSNALKTTILEKDQQLAWDRSWSKILCYVAMHLDGADNALLGVMGTVIKADNRRIEELHNEIDDDGPQVMLIVRCIVALSECIV